MKIFTLLKDYRWMGFGFILFVAVFLVCPGIVRAEVYTDPVFRRYYKKDRPRAVKRDSQEEQVHKTCAQVMEEHESQLPERISYFTEKESPEKNCREDGMCAFRLFYPQPLGNAAKTESSAETEKKEEVEVKKLKFKGFMKDQVLQDVYKEFYESGQLRLEINYQEGKKNGSFKFFYETGVLRTEKSYKNGLPDGPFRGFYSNSKLKVEAVFQQGSVVGPARTYYDNGNLMREENYAADKVDGLVKTFYKDATPRGEYRYQGGKVAEVVREFYADGALKEPVTPLDESRIPAQ